MSYLSVIIPAHNAQEYIVETLRSLETLSCLDVDVIVVDDGSTDETAYMVHSYVNGNKCLHVRLHAKKNGGVSEARNIGLALACSEWVMFLDADDMVDAEGVRRALQNVKAGVDICYGRFAYLSERGETREPKYSIPAGRVASMMLAEQFMRANEIVHIASCLFSKRFLEEKGIRFPLGYSYAEDQYFFLSAVLSAATIVNSGERMLLYRQHASSATRKATEKQADSVRLFMGDTFAARLPEPLKGLFTHHYLPLLAFGALKRIGEPRAFRMQFPSAYSLLTGEMRRFNPFDNWKPKNMIYYLLSLFPGSIPAYSGLVDLLAERGKLLRKRNTKA